MQVANRFIRFLWAATAALSLSCWAQDRPPPQAGMTLAPMLVKVTPGVVGISITQTRSNGNPLLDDPAFRRFFEESPKYRERPGGPSAADQPRPAGSGVIVDAKEGYVVTNNHVVQEAKRIVVVLADRREFEARLVGRDAGTDVALLKIQADRLTAVPVGDSDSVRVGDFVVAIGNPFGIGQTVTSGIISALGRGISPEGYEDYLQTDAAINPGNSGGALVSMGGELIGMNTAILGGSGPGGQPGNIGIGFAVPTSMIREVVAQLKQHGEVRRGRVGMQTEDVTPRMAAERKLAVTDGALVRVIERGSPAEKAGVRADDIVQAVNGRPVRGTSDLRNRVALIPVGSPARLQILRGNETVAAVLTVAPVTTSDTPGRAGDAAPPGGEALAGMQLGSSEEGVTVERVAADSRAHALGFRAGDVILSADRQAMTRPPQLTQALAAAGEHVVSVLRGESKLRIVVR